MPVRILACLPRVAAPPEGIDLDASRIVQLPFDEWLALEGQSESADYDKLRGKYTRRPPAFWESWIDADPGLVLTRGREKTLAMAAQAGPGLDTIVAALHWYTGVAPIHPRRSMVYFDAQRLDDGVPRVSGESDKEYVIENPDPAIVLRPHDAAPLASMFALARRTSPTWTSESYRHAIEALGLSSTPGLGWRARLLLLVGAFEALLVPDQHDGLQKAFTERFAELVTGDADRSGLEVEWIRTAYRLRSDLVHGRPTAATIEKLPVGPDEYVARLERAGVVAICRLLSDTPAIHQWHVDEGAS